MKHNTSYSQKDLEKHLVEEHKMSPLTEYLKEIVYGGVDGIITTFAVVAGFTGANSGSVVQYSFITVLLFGFANLFADAASMGLGNFLSIQSEKDVYKSEKEKELKEMQNNKKMEMAETVHILQNKGFSKKNAETLTKIYVQNEKYWLNFMMEQELEIPNPESTNPFYTGFATFFSFIVFGFIPLAPYLIVNAVYIAFAFSVASTLFALVLLGFLRWRATKEKMQRSIGEVVLLGSISAVVAFMVGSFFRG